MERLADQLMAVNENAFVHGSTDGALYGGRPNTEDWSISAGTTGAGASAAAAARAAAAAVADDGTGLDGDGAASAAGGRAGVSTAEELDIEVAPAGRLPFQEASLQVLSAADLAPGAAASTGDEEGAPIEGLDLGTLEAYVGVTGATVVKPAVSTPTAAAAGAAAAVLGGSSLARMETGLSEMSNPLDAMEVPAGSSRAAGRGYESEGERERGAAPGRDETAAQAAARAEFRRDTAGRWVGGWIGWKWVVLGVDGSV